MTNEPPFVTAAHRINLEILIHVNKVSKLQPKFEKLKKVIINWKIYVIQNRINTECGNKKNAFKTNFYSVKINMQSSKIHVGGFFD